MAELRKEVAAISRALSKRGSAAFEEARDRAEGAYDDASGRARAAARHVQEQAHAVTEAARENPGTAATLLTAVGVLGFLLGFVAGHSASDDRRRR